MHVHMFGTLCGMAMKFHEAVVVQQKKAIVQCIIDQKTMILLCNAAGCRETVFKICNAPYLRPRMAKIHGQQIRVIEPIRVIGPLRYIGPVLVRRFGGILVHFCVP